MQVFHLAIVDEFITGLEYDVLQKLHDEDGTPEKRERTRWTLEPAR
jgi:hypothetical protein